MRHAKKKQRPRRARKEPFAAAAYRRLDRVAMPPDERLFVAAAVAGVVLFAWLVAALWR